MPTDSSSSSCNRSLTEKLTGWLTYTLSRSERDSFNGTTGTWGHQLSEFDRTHVENLIGANDLGSGWRAVARVLANTAWPYTTTIPDGPPIARLPTLYRLDIRLEKKMAEAVGALPRSSPSGLNVLLQKEDIGVTSDNPTAP